MRLAVLNGLELRLTQSPADVLAAQALRYRVFYEELGAWADPATLASRLDRDPFDALADHLIVVDRARSTRARPHAVGCYRLLRHAKAEAAGGLYTAQEFDLAPFKANTAGLMELGRSCVAADARGGAVMQLLWRGIADYVDMHRIEVMLGCASLPGTDVAAHRPTLAWLQAHVLAPKAIRPRALPNRYVPLAEGRFDEATLRAGKEKLPPLLKAYLRMGGLIGDGAVIDEDFNTVDVCIVLPTERVKARYQRHCRQHRVAVPAAA